MLGGFLNSIPGSSSRGPARKAACKMAYALSSLDSIPTNTELSQCVANQLMSFDLCFAMLGMLPMPTLTQCICTELYSKVPHYSAKMFPRLAFICGW